MSPSVDVRFQETPRLLDTRRMVNHEGDAPHAGGVYREGNVTDRGFRMLLSRLLPRERRMRRFTVFSVIGHLTILLGLGFTVAPPLRPIFAEPLYTVAFVESPDPNYEPPKRVRSKSVRPKTETPKPAAQPPPAETVPTPEPDIAPTEIAEPKPKAKPVKPKVVPKAAQPKPKPVEKVPLKPPAKRPDEAPAEDAGPTINNPEAPEDPVSLGMVDQKDFRDSYYLLLVRRKLAESWSAPTGGAGLLKTSIHFVIRRDGTIIDPEVNGSSSDRVYDRAALGAVVNAGAMPPLPQSYDGDEIGITVVFQTRRGN